MKKRTPFKFIFDDKKKLNEMLELRKKGWTYVSLGFLYGVDFSSIYHECKKFHVEPPVKATRSNKAGIVLSPDNILKVVGLKPKKIKTYADYLKDAGYSKSQVSFYVSNIK